jgi:nicotinamide mononucleotide transporter
MKHAVVVLFSIAVVGLTIARSVDWVTFTWLETAGVITGAACVLLVVRRSIWNFPVGIASCGAYLIFFAEGRLYADAYLQIVFIVLGIHGWKAWIQGRRDSIPIRRVPLGELTALAVAFPAVWLAVTRLLEHYNGAAPVYDSFIATLSLASQWLLNRRYIESWLGWIVVDQVAVILFWSRGMHLTAVLYALFLCMCIAGLIEWRRKLDGEQR